MIPELSNTISSPPLSPSSANVLRTPSCNSRSIPFYPLPFPIHSMTDLPRLNHLPPSISSLPQTGLTGKRPKYYTLPSTPHSAWPTCILLLQKSNISRICRPLPHACMAHCPQMPCPEVPPHGSFPALFVSSFRLRRKVQNLTVLTSMVLLDKNTHLSTYMSTLVRIDHGVGSLCAGGPIRGSIPSPVCFHFRAPDKCKNSLSLPPCTAVQNTHSLSPGMTGCRPALCRWSKPAPAAAVIPSSIRFHSGLRTKCKTDCPYLHDTAVQNTHYLSPGMTGCRTAPCRWSQTGENSQRDSFPFAGST